MSTQETYKKAYMDGFSGRKWVQDTTNDPLYYLPSIWGYVEGCKARGEIIGGFTCI